MLSQTDTEVEMSEFFQTRMGQQFYGGDVPAISRALERISDNLARIATALETRPVDGPTAALLTEAAAQVATRSLGDLMDEEMASQIAYYESPEGIRQQMLQDAAHRLRLKTDAAIAKAARKDARLRAAAAALKAAESTIIGSADAEA
jgi:hypothetical protein